MQERAAEGHSDIRAYSAQFKVLGSSETIAARDNTRTNPNAHGAGEPVYWLDGPRVADDYADFYDGWDNSNPARNETGASITFRPYESGSASGDQAVWTGTNRDGSIDEGHYLGSSEPIFGMPADGGSALGSTYSHHAATLFPLYGLSGVFRLADPPPATATLTALTVSPGEIEGFAPDSTDSTEYDVGVASTVAQVTITAVPSSSRATLAYDPADDADPNAEGHQVDFTPGANTVTVTLTVTAQDGSVKTYTVNVIRGETKPVTVSFGEADYDVAEGGEVEVTVSLNEAPGREVEIPITATGQDGASEADYSPSATTVTFASGETEQRFTFTATDDTVADGGESVGLSFGTLPTGVSAGTPATATVSITDNDVRADWSLIPTGLGAGAEFRLLFVTSGSRNGRSKDIADYTPSCRTPRAGATPTSRLTVAASGPWAAPARWTPGTTPQPPTRPMTGGCPSTG